MLLAWLLVGFQSLSPLLTCKLGPSGAGSKMVGFVYVLGPQVSLQWTLLWGWEFLPLPQHLQGFFSQRVWGFISLCWNPGLCGWCCSSVVPTSLSACKCGTAHSASCHLTCPGPLSAALPWILFTPAGYLCPSYHSGWRFNSLVVGIHFDFLAVLIILCL